MLFKPYHIPMIRSGSKTQTRREWAENYSGPNVGTVVAAKTELFTPDAECDCYIAIRDVYEERLGDMTQADARREGDYETLQEFAEAYREIYGEMNLDKEVTVVKFQYVGETRPSTRLQRVKESDGDLALDYAGRVGARPYARYVDGEWSVLSMMNVPTENYRESREVLPVKATPDTSEDGLLEMIDFRTEVVPVGESPFSHADEIPHRDDVEPPLSEKEVEEVLDA